MDTKAEYIKQRLSLREPLKKALDILADLGKDLELKKNVDPARELALVEAKYPTCTDFERDFPSICFSIATGIGKTRLMGACISYLYLEKGIRNFFVLAPNLTIYNKLIKDFSEPANPKYVFQGIAEFVHNRPIVITGDNYTQQGVIPAGMIEDTAVRINIFNISKFNSETRATRSGGVSLPPRIKRLSEMLGESYWEYLSGLDDLVILMDEAHRYHASASRNAINELNPVLGIELTATPIDEQGEVFKNVVYEYSLAQALADGKYVKNQAIAKRKNFRPQGLTEKEIERIKLEDAISIHEETRNELEIYARTYNVRRVKPFVLVVCRDIAHAKEVYADVDSENFFGGAYMGKVLQIDSSTRDEEDVERQFVNLEHDDNKIEIVIHVNMLKEGWDVTNLYTIAPLRAARAPVLIEQTIGRGLRLPYNGERTGDAKIDKLTVLAHENFEEVIAAAKDPNSILSRMSFIEIPDEDLNQRNVVVKAETKMQAELTKEEEALGSIADVGERQNAKNAIDAKRSIINAINNPLIAGPTAGLKDFDKKEVRDKVIAEATQQLRSGQPGVFTEAVVSGLASVFDETLTQVRKHVIEIPLIGIKQRGDSHVTYDDFNLDTSEGFELRPLEEEIVVLELSGEKRRETIGAQQGALLTDTPVNQVVSELANYPEVDYENSSGLLYKLSGQAITGVETHLEDKSKLPLVIRQYRKVIAGKIYDQIRTGHITVDEPDYVETEVLPFVQIEDLNFTFPSYFGNNDYLDLVTPLALLPKYVFTVV